MLPRVIPRIRPPWHLGPRRLLLTSVVWGMSVGAVATVALAASVVERINGGAKKSEPREPTDGTVRSETPGSLMATAG
jgi:hypothetical protein